MNAAFAFGSDSTSLSVLLACSGILIFYRHVFYRHVGVTQERPSGYRISNTSAATSNQNYKERTCVIRTTLKTTDGSTRLLA